MSSPKKLTILFAALDAVGPTNGLTGIAEPLVARGHRAVFAVSHGWKGKLTPLGIEEEYVGEPPADNVAPSADWIAIMSVWKPWLRSTPLEQFSTVVKTGWAQGVAQTKAIDSFYKKIIEKVKPDLIVTECIVPSLTLLHSGVPYIYVNTHQPLRLLADKTLPPPYGGLRVDSDRGLWPKFMEAFWDATEETLGKQINAWFAENGVAPFPFKSQIFPTSPICNVYMTPLELDFWGGQLDGWHRFDHLMRSEENKADFELPEEFLAKPGKFIYLSLGSLGTADVELMNRLIGILSKSSHKFVVSKGPLHEQITLGDNMFGQPSLPQTRLLLQMDLVVTHGGNNTITETFAAGKAMIVMPLFLDQFDNATRVAETGYGVRLNPFTVSEAELLSTIDKVLNDKNLIERCRKAGERIRAANNGERVADLVEKVAEDHHYFNQSKKLISDHEKPDSAI